MNREEALKHKLCPQWLKDADWEGNIELSESYPYVIWKNGTWEGGFWEGGTWEDGIWERGTWEGGTWEDGTWEGGTWKGGTWEDGIWERGTWEGGTWKYGIWKDGIWKNGTWEGGFWEGGTWEDGTWKYGIWKDGIWKNGTWEDGFKAIGHCYWRVYYSKEVCKIGCKSKTFKEWDEWFDSDEEYEHSRDSEQFKKIHNTYKLAKFARDLDFGSELEDKE